MTIKKNLGKKAKFIEELVKNGGNGTQAAISAGFSEGAAACTAVRFKKDKDVQEALRASKEKAEKNLDITYENKLKVLWSIATDVEKPDKRAAISAIDVINKMDSAYTIKTDITTNGESLNAVVILPHNPRDEKTC
jgi:phage terminase small subunit